MICTYQDVLDLIPLYDWEESEDDCLIVCKTVGICWTCRNSKIVGLKMKDEIQHYELKYYKNSKRLKVYELNRKNYLFKSSSATTERKLVFNQIVNNYEACGSSDEPIPQEECNPNVGTSQNISICM